MKWANPIPWGARAQVRVYRPTTDRQVVADAICVRGWRGLGVRVFAWADGTVAVVAVGTDADARLLEACPAQQLAVYARRLMVAPGLPAGPSRQHVLEDLAWASAA